MKKKTAKKLRNRFVKYETLKATLLFKNLTPDEYEREIREICKRERI